ncbi:MAG: carbamoyltransferase C-terminal domain-containing protein [Candidatus Micrarchaeaceae archaeon]
MAILGIHDAHDAGAAIVSHGSVVSAVNEERFTKRKNDVGFPANAIRYMLKQVESEEIEKIAIPWYGGSALFARIMPGLERKRRELWRRTCKKPSRMRMHLQNVAFRLIQNQNPKAMWRFLGTHIGGSILANKLRALGLEKKLVFVEHHVAHASSAYFASGFKEALVITLDGAGDGLSGSVSIGDNGTLTRLATFKASASLGLLYGAATLACDMRYSEDEGKLMSLAAYSYPERISELEKISMYDERKKQLVSKIGIKYEFELAEYIKDTILWKYNREALAYAVQRHTEEQVLKIVKQFISETKIRNVAVAGGLFSNVIVNMLINELPEVKDFFVFPHMGDGGLALGAAYLVDFNEHGKLAKKQINNLYFGPEYTNVEIEQAIKKRAESGGIEYQEVDGIAKYVASKIAEENKIVLWFQGRMEYGPRALGNRSVLALPSDPKNRDKVNIIIKRRPYYQPFASTILEEDAQKLLSPYVRPNRFMTVGYRVIPERFNELVAASHIDMTTRPQILGDENKLYREVLLEVRNKTGFGALLNTSFNKHGMPIVMSPEEALWTLDNTGADYLAIGNFFVWKKHKQA